MSVTHDALRAANEMREQLAGSERRLGFFCGAGTSMAVGLPGIGDLTKQVAERLTGKEKEQFGLVADDLHSGSNVEEILDRVRLYRELIGTDPLREYCKIKGSEEARLLDAAICRAISDGVREISKDEKKPHLIFAQWLRALHSRRDWPVEIFTTNYDVCFEQAMEASGVPFFDGFVGSVNPFFAPECIEAEGSRADMYVYPCRSWTRLWKLHGSINWHIRSAEHATEQITRLSTVDSKPGEELAVFPGRNKYSESRKLPFLAMQDRLRKFLAGGDRLLVIAGYSFSDQHLNEVILQALRSNPQLAVTALIFGEDGGEQDKTPRILPKSMENLGSEHRNLTIFGPDKASIGGVVGGWSVPARESDSREWPFWNSTQKMFVLGDFTAFARFLEVFIGFKPLTPAAQNPVTK